ncbi:hypothetical protein BR93DRAFT_963056 [Coniochaeta sp. PMI_546]|nr:hypothetical protein BR93DRAFT_963056 [Coniochaeta sp. PMI_546]
MASKHRILIPPAWPSRLADPSAIDLKTATPPAISSPEYVSKLEAALTPEESAKLQELDPNDTRSEIRLLARPTSTQPSTAGLLKDRENSTKHSSSSSDVPPEKIQPCRIQNRICLDPAMHPNQSHSEMHHPGLLPLADFCDFGVDTAPEVHTATPQKTLLDRFWHDLAADDVEGHPQILQSNPPVPTRGRVFRALTGGDICVEDVDVEGHFHVGHPPIIKVRPATGVTLVPQHTHHQGHRDPVSKLGPLIKGTAQSTLGEESNPDVKRQPSNYWGFSAKHDRSEEVSFAKDESLPTGVIGPPKLTDEYGAPEQGNQDRTQILGDKAIASSGDEPIRPSGVRANQCFRQDDYLRCLSEEHKVEGIHGPLETTCGPESRKPGSESWIQKRTSHWLKDLLHQPDAYSSRLTHLPGKNVNRRNTISSPRDVLWANQHDPAASRPLTRHSVDYSYKRTFNDLENILNSAVQLAKEAVEHFEFNPSKSSGHGSAA